MYTFKGFPSFPGLEKAVFPSLNEVKRIQKEHFERRKYHLLLPPDARLSLAHGFNRGEQEAIACMK